MKKIWISKIFVKFQYSTSKLYQNYIEKTLQKHQPYIFLLKITKNLNKSLKKQKTLKTHKKHKKPYINDIEKALQKKPTLYFSVKNYKKSKQIC